MEFLRLGVQNISEIEAYNIASQLGGIWDGSARKKQRFGSQIGKNHLFKEPETLFFSSSKLTEN